VLLRGKRDVDQCGSPTLAGGVKCLNNFCRILPSRGIFGQLSLWILTNVDWLDGWFDEVRLAEVLDSTSLRVVVSKLPWSIAESMSNDIYQLLQCTYSAFFPTSDALNSHLDEYRVSIPLPASIELTLCRLKKATCLLSWKYAGPTQKLMTTTTAQMFTRMMTTRQ
jgi:hypothetical protein